MPRALPKTIPEIEAALRELREKAATPRTNKSFIATQRQRLLLHRKLKEAKDAQRDPDTAYPA